MYKTVYNKIMSSTSSSNRGDCVVCFIKPYYHISKFLGFGSVNMKCSHDTESDIRTIETSKMKERVSLVISTFLLLCSVKCIEEVCKIKERNFTVMYKYIYLMMHTWGAAGMCLSYISNIKRMKPIFENMDTIFKTCARFHKSMDSHERFVNSIKNSVRTCFCFCVIFMIVSFTDCMNLAEGTEWYYFKFATAFIAYNSYAIYTTYIIALCIILRELINGYNQQLHVLIQSISQKSNVIEGRNTAHTLQTMVELYNKIYTMTMAFIEYCSTSFFIYVIAIPALEFLSAFMLFVEGQEGKLDIVAVKTLIYIFIPDYIFTSYIDQLNNIVSTTPFLF